MSKKKVATPSRSPSPANPFALLARASHLFDKGQAAQAAPLCRQVLRLQPQNAGAWQLLGITQIVDDQPADAILSLQKALELDGRNTRTLCLIATACAQTGRAQEALAFFDQALAIDPSQADIWYDRGNVLQAQQENEAALASYDRALAIAPRHANAWLNRGHLLLALHQHREAITSIERAVDIAPRDPRAWQSLGKALFEAQRFVDALACHEKVVHLDHKHVEGWLSFAEVLLRLGRPDLALERLDVAARLSPDSSRGLILRANALHRQRRQKEEIETLRRAHAFEPDNAVVTGSLMTCMLQTASWDDLQPILDRVLASSRAGTYGSQAFAMLAHPDAVATDILQACQTEGKVVEGGTAFTAKAPARAPTVPGRRLRVGYLSSDLGDHPVTLLMAGVFKSHDRRRLETFAFSTNPQANQSARHEVLKKSFDHFLDLHKLGDAEAADTIRRFNIDLLVDLNGRTQGCRPGIVVRQPAAVQVGYLGFPGTSGMDQVDYIIGDRWVTPLAEASTFSEKLVLMPDSFQANDNQRPIGSATPSRVELGLPEGAFVFCCLSNSYKINPALFDIWMRLLKKLPSSVLWLVGEHDFVQDNLRAQASTRGVEPSRLVFAKRLAYEQYLAQYRQADLFLDTLPFNAGTTASDALWAGLPVLTQLGQTFAGRMAASLLDNVGLPELITRSADEYEALAFQLASEPALLQGYRDWLRNNISTAPLFDTARFTAHIERAFEHMVTRHRQGLPPETFKVESLEAPVPISPRNF